MANDKLAELSMDEGENIMGCLLDFLFEILIEGVLGLVMYVYLKLTSFLIPGKVYSENTENKIRNIVTTISVILTLVLFIGVLFLLPNDTTFNTIGKYMTSIPLSIIGIQAILGIVVVVVKMIKNKGN